MPADIPVQHHLGGEIGFIEIWLLLVRRKIWVLAGLVITLGIGLAYIILKTPLYEARVRMQIGQVGGAGPFEPTEVLAARLISRYGENVADGVVRPKPFLSHASPQKGEAHVVEFMAQGDRPEDPAALLRKIFEEIRQAHAEPFARNVQALTDQLGTVDARRADLLQHLQDTASILALLKTRDPVQASLVMMERGRALMLLSTLDEQRPKLIQALSVPQTQPTRLLGDVAVPSRPAAPRRAYVIALATVAGLLLGVLIALGAEFVARAGAATA